MTVVLFTKDTTDLRNDYSTGRMYETRSKAEAAMEQTGSGEVYARYIEAR